MKSFRTKIISKKPKLGNSLKLFKLSLKKAKEFKANIENEDQDNNEHIEKQIDEEFHNRPGLFHGFRKRNNGEFKPEGNQDEQMQKEFDEDVLVENLVPKNWKKDPKIIKKFQKVFDKCQPERFGRNAMMPL